MTTAAPVAHLRARALSETGLFFSALGAFVVWQLGAHIDAWYHAHYGFEIESFLTWPHALLYAGWVASAIPASAYLLESVALGLPRQRWLPRGYTLVLVAAALFGLGGMFDFGWHSLFGFEVSLEALLSPSHLWLIFAAMLGYAGLFWAAVERRRDAETVGARRAADIGVLITLGLLLRVTLYALLYSNPYSTDYASGGAVVRDLFGFAAIRAWSDMSAQVAGTTGIFLHAVLLALFVVVPLRALRLPRGAIAAVMLWNAALTLVAMPEMWIYLPAVAGGAVTGELLWAWMRRGRLGGVEGRGGYWAIAFAVPAVQFFLYFGLMAEFGGGVRWTTPLWAGAPVLAGVYGLSAILFAVPPRFATPALTSGATDSLA